MQRTWTNFTGNCRSCGESFQASQEAIDDMRKDSGTATDEEIGTGLDICLECCTGHAEQGEKPELDALVEATLEAFWSEAVRITKARSGDLAADVASDFEQHARNTLREWVRVNAVQLDK